MKKILASLITWTILLVTAPYAGAQGGIMVSGGVASYKMSDMKYYQEYILSTYHPVEGKITSSFPPYTSVSVTGFKQLYDYLRLGISYTYSTTGGKSSYQDYSGEIYTEMTATSHRLGAYLSYILLGGDRIDLSLHGRLDANYSTMISETYWGIMDSYGIYYYGGNSNKYWSISPTGSIGTDLLYNLRKFSLGIEAGYLVDLKGTLKDDGDPLQVQDPNDGVQELTSDWSGWYTRISLLINIRE